MLVMPALDIRCGKFSNFYDVQLFNGMEEYDDPVEVAKWWKKEGAEFLHINDLDGFFTGKVENIECIEAIHKAVDLPLQVMGGICCCDAIKRYENLGIERIVFSPSLLTQREFDSLVREGSNTQLVLGIEQKNGCLAVAGWRNITPWSTVQIAKRSSEFGIKRILVNDLQKEGTLNGPNFQLVEEVTKWELDVTLSGGVASVEDLKNLKNYEKYGLDSVIVGKALYNQRIDYNQIKSFIE